MRTPEAFAPPPEIATLYNQGLHVLKSHPESAEAIFRDTGRRLMGLPNNPRRQVLISRLQRDEVNANLRLVATDEVADSHKALRLGVTKLEEAAQILGELSGTSKGSEKDYLDAERGACFTFLGRLGVVASVLHHKEVMSGFSIRQHFSQGHELTRSNLYYRTSNAMNAARHERLRGNANELRTWFGRGVTALTTSLATRDGDAMRSLETFGRLAQDIGKGPQAIQEAVKRSEI